MSEKITFQELIDSIADEAETSKSSARDFLKEFVSVVHLGLKEDKKTNVAGFGSFKLKEVNEREGFNPQTGEKITIPAHQKVVFKPYKQLRELVNAPFSHLEPSFVEENEPEEDLITNIAEPERTDEIPTEEDTAEQNDGDPFQFDFGEKPEEGQSFSFFEEASNEENIDNEGVDDSNDIVEFLPEAPPPTTLPGKEQENEKENEEGKEQEASPTPEPPPPKPESEPETQHQKEPEPEPPIEPDPPKKPEDELFGSIFSEPTEESDEDKHEENQPQLKTEDDSVNPPTDPRKKAYPSPRKQNRFVFVWVMAAIVLIAAVISLFYWTEMQNPPADTIAEAESQQVSAQENEPSENPEEKEAESGTDEPDESTAPQEVTVQSGQTLWSIADDTYDNPYLWPWIYLTNQSDIYNPNIILAGQSLDVPLPYDEDNLNDSDSLDVAKGYVQVYQWNKERENESAHFYLWAAYYHHQEVFDHVSEDIDEDDLAFVNRVR